MNTTTSETSTYDYTNDYNKRLMPLPNGQKIYMYDTDSFDVIIRFLTALGRNNARI